MSSSAAFFSSVESWIVTIVARVPPPEDLLERVVADHEPFPGPLVEAFHRSFEGGLHVDAGFRKEPVERLPEDLRVRPPDELPERPVAPPDPAVRIGQEEHVVDAVDRPLPLLLGRRDQAVDAGELVVLLPEFREPPGDALRGPRHADGDFVPVEEPLDVPKVPLFLLPREPGGPDQVEVRLAEKFDEPEEDPERHPLAAAFARLDDAERGESVVAAHVVGGERGRGGVGAERLEQGAGQPAERGAPRLGSPGDEPEISVRLGEGEDLREQAVLVPDDEIGQQRHAVIPLEFNSRSPLPFRGADGSHRKNLQNSLLFPRQRVVSR